MRVLIIGANGSIGKRLVEKLKGKNHEPIAMIRDEKQARYFQNIDVSTVIADLEMDFEHAFNQIDAVIFTAGSGPKTGADKTIIIDQEGAIESIELAKKYNIKRFMMVSAMRANNPKHANSIKHYLYAKHRADEHLKKSGLLYTIIRPGKLTDELGTGSVNLQEELSVRGEIPREDVASVITQLLTDFNTINISFDLISGQTPISELEIKGKCTFKN